MIVRAITPGMMGIGAVHTNASNPAPGSLISAQLTSVIASVARRFVGPAMLLAPAVAAAAPIEDGKDTGSCGLVLVAGGVGALCGALTAVSAKLDNRLGALAGIIGGAFGVATFALAVDGVHPTLAQWSDNIAVSAIVISAATNLRAVQRRVPPA